jgi:cyclopropane-fatty-acyl-phospholipid synthase
MSDDATDVKNRTLVEELEPLPSTVSKVMSRLFERFTHGVLVMELPSGERVERRGELAGPEAIIKLHNWRALRRLVTRGDIGFAEGYIAGDWTAPNLVTLFEWAHLNEDALVVTWKGSGLERVLERFRHIRRANTKRGSRRNIADHYDLGNEFYAAWLDASMSYSSALYENDTQSLEDAQYAKIDRAISMLDVDKGHKVLEIGCGWGALAERLIKKSGCQLTGITLSKAQLAWARPRVESADGSGGSQLFLQDYRDVQGQFDRIVSIEMFEAAGEKYWPVFFETMRNRLVPGGIAVLQVITIEKPRFEAYRRRPDFIQRYIFPGGMLPTDDHMTDLADASGLRLERKELFGQSYAKTLGVWRQRFLRAAPRLDSKLSSDQFRNMWEYYLAYCEIGFRLGALDVGLYRFRRPK